MTATAVIAHAAVAAVIVIAYAVMTITGHDGNTLLAILGGQGIGGIVQTAATTAAPGGNGSGSR